MEWLERDIMRFRRQETIGGGEGFRAGNFGVVRTDIDPMTRECVGLLEIRKGWRWLVPCAGCNREARARQKIVLEREYWCEWTTIRQDEKGLGVGQAIRLTSMNIWSRRAGGLKEELRSLKQRNMDVGVIQEIKLIKGMHTWYGTGYAV